MVKTSGVTEKLRTENANPEHEHGTGNVELGTTAFFQVPGSWFRSAKGGTRTPIPFRVPDPKSGASASSATFASDQPITGNGPKGQRSEGATGRWCEGPVQGPGSWCHAVFRRALGRIRSIRGRTLARRAARFTFEMMSSSTGPREDAREFMARRAGTRLILSCTLCASSVV